MCLVGPASCYRIYRFLSLYIIDFHQSASLSACEQEEEAGGIRNCSSEIVPMIIVIFKYHNYHVMINIVLT